MVKVSSTIQKGFLLIMLLISVSLAQAAITSNPGIGSWSSTTVNVSGCTSSPNILKACVSAISGNTISVQIKRIDNGYFLSSGSVYVSITTPCGSYYTSGSYNTSMNLVTLTFTASIGSGSSVTIYGTTVSTSGSRCHSGSIVLSNITPSVVVTPTSLSFSSGASSQQFSVTTNVSCTVSSNSSYFTVSPATVAANTCTYVTVTAAANYSSSRSATITVTGGGLSRTVSISQAAGTCPTLMTWYSQVNPNWSGIIHGTCTSTIGQTGCAITCGADLLTTETSNSTNFTPTDINTYLKNNSGYSGGCNVIWSKIADADGSDGLVYYNSNFTQNNWSWLDQQLDNCRKVIVNVHNSSGGNHYVLVKARSGSSGTGSSYKVLDPGITNYAVKTLADFSNIFYSAHSYSGTWGNGSYKDGEEDEEFFAYEPSSFDNKVYPNPISSSTSLNYEVYSNRLQTVPVRVFDLSGRMVSEGIKYFGEGVNTGSIQTPDIGGFYFVIFSFDDNTNLTKKLIVQ